MTPFAARCGVATPARAAACAEVLARVHESRLERVRIAWCDPHGHMRCKTLVAGALADALDDGVSMVGTLLLKDLSDRTAFPVFERRARAELPGFAYGGNLVLLPDPASLRMLPWAPDTGWLRADTFFPDGMPVALDPRRQLQRALAALGGHGYAMRCGLEIEFHVYRALERLLDPALAAWPAPAPAVALLHGGYRLLSETDADRCDEVFVIVQRTCEGLGLPLRSLEIEFGPSQFEAVFDSAEALATADAAVLFRNAVAQALARAGFHASFVCRPPFAHAQASGWHLHQSLTAAADGANAFVRPEPAAGSTPADAAHMLSDAGQRWLAGLLAHGRAMAAFAVPTIDGYGRFRPHAMAPQSVLWGRDNRGAMLRVVGAAGDRGTRIENRIGEPAANPYLYIAAQVWAGLDGLARALVPPPATDAPYAADGGAGEPLPASLAEALAALSEDAVFADGFGRDVVDWWLCIGRQQIARHDAAEDRAEWLKRETFGRL